MDQIQPAEATTSAASSPETTTAAAGPDLVDTAPAVPVHPARARALALVDDLTEIEAQATRTPNVGELVARLAGLMRGVLVETVAELDRMGV